MSGKPDPRPKKGSPIGLKRTKSAYDERKVIKRIRATKCLECRLCGTNLGVNAHHLIPRSLGGIWTESNIVGLCGSGTTGCHGLIEARDKAACHYLRSVLTDAEYSYVLWKKGEGFLDRYYPAVWSAA